MKFHMIELNRPQRRRRFAAIVAGLFAAACVGPNAARQQGSQNFNRAFAACMTARNYQVQ